MPFRTSIPCSFIGKENKMRRYAHWFLAGQKWHKMDILTVHWTDLVSWMRIVKDTDCDEQSLSPSAFLSPHTCHTHTHTWSHLLLTRHTLNLNGNQAGPYGAPRHTGLCLPTSCKQEFTLQDLPGVPKGRFEQLLIKGGAAKKTT